MRSRTGGVWGLGWVLVGVEIRPVDRAERGEDFGGWFGGYFMVIEGSAMINDLEGIWLLGVVGFVLQLLDFGGAGVFFRGYWRRSWGDGLDGEVV